MNPRQIVRRYKAWRRYRRMTRLARASRANFVMRWINWSPKRYRLVTSIGLAVVVLAVALKGQNVVDAIQWRIYDQKVASYNAQVAKEQREVLERTTADVMEAAQVAADPTAAPTTVPLPSSLPAGLPAKSAAALLGANDVAEKFLTAWSSGASQGSNAAWILAMQPYATPVMLDSFRLTDHAAMPKGLKVTDVETHVTDTTALTTATAGAFGPVKLTLELGEDGKWRATSFVPADGH